MEQHIFSSILPRTLTAVASNTNFGNLAPVYGVVALVAIVLALGYHFLDKHKDRKLQFLFLCVAVTNCGYHLLSVSKTLSWAMMANRISYLGAAFSVMLMLMVIMEVCAIPRPRWATVLMLAVSTLAFSIAASGDWGGLYYTQVSIEILNGTTRLIKDYGPLHILYPIYLLGTVLAMIVVILYSIFRKNIDSAKHALLLIASVLINVGVWSVEQMIQEEFEFLSVSMVLSEVILLLLYSMLRDYRSALAQQQAPVLSSELPRDLETLFEEFADKVTTLSSAERRILDYYIQGYEISDIPDMAYISIHTVKKHNRSIYQKLGVASRDDLMLFIELFRRSGRLQQLSP